MTGASPSDAADPPSTDPAVAGDLLDRAGADPDWLPPPGARRNWLLVRSMLGLHPRLFALSFAGATVFAIGTVASSFALRWVIDHVVLERFERGDVAIGTFLVGAGLIIGIGLVRALGVVFRRAAASAGMWRVAETYTNQVLDRFVAQPVEWHRGHPDGDLIARAGVDTETTVSVIAPIPFASSTVLMLAISTVWLFSIDVPLGLVAIVVFPLILGVNVVYERSVSTHFSAAQEQLGDFSAAVHESFDGVSLVKAYGAEERETERLAGLADRVRESRLRAIRLRTWFEALQDVLPALANIALVLLGAARVESGDVTVGEFTSVIFLFTLLVFPLRLIGYALSELPRSMAAWLRIQRVLHESVPDDPASSLAVAVPPVGVSFDHVGFRYADGTVALDDVDLTVDAGAVTALVGPTGSGKSTLADLALGLVSPTSGAVAVVPGRRALVFQEAFLLADTIRENVAFGDSFEDEDIWAALRRAAGDDFVRALPRQLDTVVGERGVSLSGGQRQRVALARALVRRPALLVLDDTTSALDPATEAAVLERLRGDAADRAVDGSAPTVLMIATRPSTIALADRVVFLAGGRVVATGRHDDLVESEPSYRELVQAFEADRTAPGPLAHRYESIRAVRT